ncbi:hypothetical protein ACFFRR_011606 [Megaselia abdita]
MQLHEPINQVRNNIDNSQESTFQLKKHESAMTYYPRKYNPKCLKIIHKPTHIQYEIRSLKYGICNIPPFKPVGLDGFLIQSSKTCPIQRGIKRQITRFVATVVVCLRISALFSAITNPMLKGLVFVFFSFVGFGECVQIHNLFHQNHHHQPLHHQHHLHHVHHEHHEDYHDHHPKYEFEYGVKDPKTGDEKSQHEHRDGDYVKGQYSIHDADGTKRIVEYSSDKKHGFQANVKRLGHAHHPDHYKINHHYHHQPEHHHHSVHPHHEHHHSIHHSQHRSYGHGAAESYVNIKQHFK